MENIIKPSEWESYMDNIEMVSIDGDFILFRNPSVLPVFKYPFRIDMTIAVICLRGKMTGIMNMKHYVSQAPCFTIVLANQILQQEEVSDDFDGLFIVMSKKFSDNLFNNMKDILSLEFLIKEHPVVSINPDELDILRTYYAMFTKIVLQTENPNRLDIIKHLTLAFFYNTGAQIHKIQERDIKSKQEMLLSDFFKVVQAHFKKERSVNFYADKLCLTPKYLTTVIRQNTGKTASDWIDQYVMLEAKTLLKSSKLTIQQISDELNFPSQSFFGKFFKRHEGISPSDYKKK